jgi:DNA-binding SARP family transcriptional activator
MRGRSPTTICLFGAYPIRVGGQPYHLGISGKTEQLFQYLLVNLGRESRREYLADLFWRNSTAERQRSALNSAIWRIKRQLGAVEGVDLHCDGPAVFLHIEESVETDARALTEIVHSLAPGIDMDAQVAARLRLALDACAAPFMDGVTSDWVLTERERLFNLQIRGMTLLMHWLGQQRSYEDALEIGRRLLAADPARESAQCEVMWLYMLNGQRAQAIRQYKWFRKWLREELEIEPMPETKALYDHIRQELTVDRPGMPESSARSPQLESGRKSFNLLLGAIERSRRDLYEVLSSQSA